jgi:uncharacterized protein YecE (DUF72 family)
VARARLGTSGFDYQEWRGTFYPDDLPHAEFLRHYATRLPSVEIDSTFYRMPNAKRIEAWLAATPEDFRFGLKVSRRITHQERVALPSETLDYLVRTVGGLGPRLGVLLFQLPPYFRADAARLEALLDALPPELPAAFEFRHASWFDREIYGLLARSRRALVIHDGDEGTTPVEVTGPLAYLRLRRSSYPAGARAEWVQRIRSWVAAGIDVFAYVKHEENPDAPRIALELAGELG